MIPGALSIKSCNRNTWIYRYVLSRTNYKVNLSILLDKNVMSYISFPSVFLSQETVGRVCLKERGRDVLVLQRVTSSVTSPSDRPSPTSSGGGSREEDCDKRSVPPT